MYTIIYKGKSISYNENNIHIKNSYKVKNSAEMEEALRYVVARAAKRGITYKRSMASWIREWKTHNFLCGMKYKVAQTSSVDLNENESLFRRLSYFILALFYRG